MLAFSRSSEFFDLKIATEYFEFFSFSANVTNYSFQVKIPRRTLDMEMCHK